MLSIVLQNQPLISFDLPFCFEMRANLPGIGAGQALREKLDLCTARREYWMDKENNYKVYFN